MSKEMKKYDNSRLVRLNMDNATDEQKISWLCRIIDNELEKPENETDNDLILECSKCIDLLTPESEKLTPEELAANLERIKAKAAGTDGGKVITVRKPKKRIAFRIIAAVAAVLILMSAAVSVAAAAANGYDSVLKYVLDILSMKPGEIIEGNGITIIVEGKPRVYDTIEELLESEGYDIMYPTVLPDRVRIEKVLVAQTPQTDRVTISYLLSTNIYININNYYANTLSNISSENMYKTKYGYTFGIIKADEGFYQAMYQSNGYECTVVAYDYQKLILIIDNMKEIGK